MAENPTTHKGLLHDGAIVHIDDSPYEYFSWFTHVNFHILLWMDYIFTFKAGQNDIIDMHV